jgi:RNA polymerase sigma factor (sigma-70 family)
MSIALSAAAGRPRARFSQGDREQVREAERELLLRYHRDGDLGAREELVERFLPLARDLALRYTYTDEPFDDLFQVASLGLIKAIDRFEPARGTKFTSYAAPTILGELKRHFRDKGWALHVPRDLQERALAVGRERERGAVRGVPTERAEGLIALKCRGRDRVDGGSRGQGRHTAEECRDVSRALFDKSVELRNQSLRHHRKSAEVVRQ